MKLDKKNIIVIIIVIAVAFISWEGTVKNTFKYKKELSAISLEELLAKEKRYQNLSSQNLNIENAMTAKNISNIPIREVLFKFALESDSLKILDYNDSFSIVTEDVRQNFFQLNITGNYRELISLADYLLKKCPSTKLEHLDLSYQKKNFKSEEMLLMKIILSVNL